MFLKSYSVKEYTLCSMVKASLTFPIHILDIDECASSPCQNNGLCVNLRNRYRCLCPMPYIGRRCEIGEECNNFLEESQEAPWVTIAVDLGTRY